MIQLHFVFKQQQPQQLLLLQKEDFYSTVTDLARLRG